jgi:hypothetical protein
MNYSPANRNTGFAAAGGVQLMDCGQGTLVCLERVKYFNRQLLTADDMTTEQNYFLQKLRRHNRFLHGWGVVCGLQVTAAPTAALPWQVRIESGYALGPYGDEIFVGEPFLLDLAKCGPNAGTDPCEPGLLGTGTGGVGASVYVAIRYAECLARPVLAMPPGCGCDEEPCEFSRICDSFEVQCLPQLPPSPPPGPTLCDIVQGGQIIPCPPCPDDPWVVLALVNLPAAPSTDIGSSNIDNISVRRIVFSAAVLQEQLIECCCGPQSSSSSSSSSSSTTSTVDLQSILVRQTGAPDGAFSSNAQIGVFQPPAHWDFKLTLTGPAPAGGLSVTIASDHTNVTKPPSPVTVPVGQSSLIIPNVPANPNIPPAIVVKIMAKGRVNTSTATLIFD